MNLGGEILSQRNNNHILLMSVNSDAVTMTLTVPLRPRIDIHIPARLLDNRWHTIEFLYQLGVLNLIIDNQPTVLGTR